MSYEITFSITAVCPCCGKDLPPSSYLTVSKPSDGPFNRDNPYERKDRRVFITPCADCFEWKGARAASVMEKEQGKETGAAGVGEVGRG
jgi:hypothetical protein